MHLTKSKDFNVYCHIRYNQPLSLVTIRFMVMDLCNQSSERLQELSFSLVFGLIVIPEGNRILVTYLTFQIFSGHIG